MQCYDARMQRTLGRIIISIAALALASAGCGDSSEDQPNDVVADAGGGGGDPGDDQGGEPGPDASTDGDGEPTGPLACAGKAPPQTAPATIQLSGTAVSLDTRGVANVRVSFANDAGSSQMGGTTDAQGRFSIDVATGGNAINGYLLAEGGGPYYPTYFYSAVPFSADQGGLTMLRMGQTEIRLMNNGTALRHDEDNVLVAGVVLDCDGNPLEGAVVTATPTAGQVAYTRGTTLDPTATGTASDGVFMITDVVTGTTTVTATYQGTQLRAIEFDGQRRSIVSTAIVP